MKRTIATITALLLLLGLLAGCGVKPPEPPTAASLLREMSENLTAARSCTAAVQGFVDFRQESDGSAAELRLDADLTADVLREPRLAMHLDGSAGFAILGMDMDLPLEMYLVDEEESMTLYLRVLDSWVKQSVPMPETSSDGEKSVKGMSALAELAVLQEATEQIRDTETYRIDMTVTGDMLLSAIKGAGQGSGSVPLDLSGVKIACTLWLDTETRLPVRQTVTMDTPIAMDGMSIQRFQILADYTGFGTVESIAPPPEAAGAPELENSLGELL